MERTKKTEDGKIKWVKQGGGSFRMTSGKIIKPGQTFFAHPNDIPEGFRDTIVPLDKLPPETSDTIDVVKTEYKVQQRGESNLWYDVVDGEGKVINEKALKRTAALELIKALE
jgi:hypothetical protein